MDEIIEKLKELKSIDSQFHNFGSSSHEYKLNPSLSIEDFESIEEKYSCNFPDEYKYFITNIGNGGAGPFYGLFPIEQQDDNHDMCSWEAGYLIGDLSQPFTHTKEWNLDNSFWENEPDPDQCETEEQEDELWEAWHKELEAKYWAPHIMNGAIPICHQGCAIRTWLVVTGPMKGTVWDDYRCDNDGIMPVKNKDGKYASFSDWYIDWLNQSILEAKNALSKKGTEGLDFIHKNIVDNK
jgi:hypothetical protein